MKRYKEHRPTSFDRHLGVTPSRDHWYMVEYSITRDTDDCLQLSNWHTLCEELQADNTPGCEIHRFGHWGPGWYEIILIHPWRKDLIKLGEELEHTIQECCIIDDEDYYRRQQEIIEESWESWGYTDLQESFLKRLFEEMDDPAYDYWFEPSDCELEYNQHEVRSIVESCYQVISEHDSHWKEVDRRLADTPLKQLWSYIKAIELPAVWFNDLPHEIYHLIHQLGITVTDCDSKAPLEVPEYIAAAYSINQLKLF